MDRLNQVEVTIMDEKMILQGGESEDYILALAKYINMKADELKAQSNGALIGQTLKHMLITINITDELFQERERIKQLEQELQGVRKELDDFIEEFEQEQKGIKPKKDLYKEAQRSAENVKKKEAEEKKNGEKKE